MSSRRIHNDDLEPLLSELLNTLQGNGHRISLSVRPKVHDLGFGGGLACLIECARTKGVRTDNGRFEPSFLVVYCELCTCSGFAVSLLVSELRVDSKAAYETTYLQTDSHNDIRLALLGFVRFYSRIDQRNQFIKDRLYTVICSVIILDLEPNNIPFAQYSFSVLPTWPCPSHSLLSWPSLSP